MLVETQLAVRIDRLEDEGGLDHGRADPVRVNVGSGTTIFQVSLALDVDRSGNSDRGTSIRNTGGKRRGGSSLVLSGKTLVVVLSVNLDVLQVPLGELLDVLVNGLDSTLFSGLLGGVVGVATGTVPLSLGQGLGVERGSNTPFLTDPQQEESGHPEVVTHLDTLTGSDLELPLSGHDLGVDSRDLDSGVKTSTVVSLDEITGKDLAGSNSTVVRTLRSGETALGPTVRRTIRVEESVLLLESEPGFVLLGQVHVLLTEVPVVVGGGGTVGEVTSTKDHDVVSTSERVGEDSTRPQEDIGIVSRSLLGGRTIKVPLLQFLDIGDLSRKSHGLASHSTGSIDPDVLGHDLATLRQVHVRLPQINSFSRDDHLDINLRVFWLSGDIGKNSEESVNVF